MAMHRRRQRAVPRLIDEPLCDLDKIRELRKFEREKIDEIHSNFLAPTAALYVLGDAFFTSQSLKPSLWPDPKTGGEAWGFVRDLLTLDVWATEAMNIAREDPETVDAIERAALGEPPYPGWHCCSGSAWRIAFAHTMLLRDDLVRCCLALSDGDGRIVEAALSHSREVRIQLLPEAFLRNMHAPVADEALREYLVRPTENEFAIVHSGLDRLRLRVAEQAHPTNAYDSDSDDLPDEPTESQSARAPAAAGAGLPRLKLHDKQAWQLSVIAGMTQVRIARTLNEQHGTTYSQGEVSRMIARAKRHAEASGLTEKLPARAERARAVDPGKLELGARTDKGRPRRSESTRPDCDR